MLYILAFGRLSLIMSKSDISSKFDAKIAPKMMPRGVKSQLGVSETRFLEPERWKSESGSWKLEPGNWKWEPGTWKLEAGGPGPAMEEPAPPVIRSHVTEDRVAPGPNILID